MTTTSDRAVRDDFGHGFQAKPWDLPIAPAPFPTTPPSAIGTRYMASVSLDDGYYEYKYHVEFDNGEKRWVSDPCARYGGESDDNAAFVVGGSWPAIRKLEKRKPLADLVIYELMVDDFAAKLASEGLADAHDAPLEAIRKPRRFRLRVGDIPGGRRLHDIRQARALQDRLVGKRSTLPRRGRSAARSRGRTAKRHLSIATFFPRVSTCTGTP